MVAIAQTSTVLQNKINHKSFQAVVQMGRDAPQTRIDTDRLRRAWVVYGRQMLYIIIINHCLCWSSGWWCSLFFALHQVSDGSSDCVEMNHCTLRSLLKRCDAVLVCRHPQ